MLVERAQIGRADAKMANRESFRMWHFGTMKSKMESETIARGDCLSIDDCCAIGAFPPRSHDFNGCRHDHGRIIFSSFVGVFSLEDRDQHDATAGLDGDALKGSGIVHSQFKAPAVPRGEK